jgi:hypothetical protein
MTIPPIFLVQKHKNLALIWALKDNVSTHEQIYLTSHFQVVWVYTAYQWKCELKQIVGVENYH